MKATGGGSQCGLTDRELVALIAATVIGRRTNGGATDLQIARAVDTARRIIQRVEDTEL